MPFEQPAAPAPYRSPFIFNSVRLTWNGTTYAIMRSELEAEALRDMILESMKGRGVKRLPVFLMSPCWCEAFLAD